MQDAMWRGHGGWEIALSPVLVGLLGWLVDGWLDTRPIFTIVGVMVGLGGSVTNQYYQYNDRMEQAAQNRIAAREAKFGPESDQRFGPVEAIDAPDYVLESDLILESDLVLESDLT